MKKLTNENLLFKPLLVVLLSLLALNQLRAQKPQPFNVSGTIISALDKEYKNGVHYIELP